MGTATATAERLHLRLVEPGRHATLEQVARHRTREDHLARLRIFAATRPVPPVFSHWSAALVHGLPLLRDPPPTIHILAAGTRETACNGIVAHARGDDPPIDIRGLRVTSVARTVADLAAATSLPSGVTAADFALSRGPFDEREALITRAELLDRAERLPAGPGRRRALAVAAFADGRTESPLESVSRVTLALAGAPPPRLQLALHDLTGFTARLDFAWPALALAAEADGRTKYLHPALRRGRTPAEVLAARSARDHAIEASGLRLLHWTWQTARRADRMRALLQREGVPLAPAPTAFEMLL